MKKLLIIFSILILILLTTLSCTNKRNTGISAKKYTLELEADIYGNIAPTAVDLNESISVKVYKDKKDLDDDYVAFEYTGERFLDKSKPILIYEGYEIVVSLKLQDEENNSSYIVEDNIYNFDTTRDTCSFTMKKDKSLLVILSEDAITAVNFNVKSDFGGEVYFSTTKLDANIVIETNIVNFSENKVIPISSYFFSPNYKIELQTSEIVIQQQNFEFAGWKDSSTIIKTDKSLEIDKTSPTTITATFSYIEPNYGENITPEEPNVVSGDGWILIGEPSHLLWIADEINNKNNTTVASAKYRFTNDIDYEGGYHPPIGNSRTQFTGRIDGDGYSLKNAKITQTFDRGHAGFVGFLQGTGQIINLTIEDSVTIDTTANYVGSISGRIDGASVMNSTLIANCVNKATINVSYSSQVGGITSRIDRGTVRNSYNSGDIYVDNVRNIGGIASWNAAQVTIANCYNTGNIYYTGKNNAALGGVYGSVGNSFSQMYNVYSTGKIYSETSRTIGGVLGSSGGVARTIYNVYFVMDSLDVPVSGFSSGDFMQDDVDRTVETLGWDEVFRVLDTKAPNTWKQAPEGRPVLKDVGEGK